MPLRMYWKLGRLAALGVGLLVGLTVVVLGQPCACLTLKDLERMDYCQLESLFTSAEVGTPICGVANGRLVYLADERLPRLKVRLANSVWRGKQADENCHFVNRWIGGVRWIGSEYTIGPSWMDGKPAVVMEYPPGTKLFWNMHDELREIQPGLYLGPVFERFPCPKFRGFVALQLKECDGK